MHIKKHLEEYRYVLFELEENFMDLKQSEMGSQVQIFIVHMRNMHDFLEAVPEKDNFW